MANQNPVVTFTMENGDIMKAELYPEVAPNTVNNFISLVKKGFYDGLIFHRIIAGFMIQGGDQIGIYFLEKKTSQRPSNVIYNRSGSAIALAEESDFDWDAIFEDATWFHFSGITPECTTRIWEYTLP
jgi:hypothetical protein